MLQIRSCFALKSLPISLMCISIPAHRQDSTYKESLTKAKVPGKS